MIRIGILGLGPAGKAMRPFIEGHASFRLAALCDLREEALAGGGDLLRTTSIDEFCAADFDAAFVATPTWLHCEHTLRLLRAGKHVIVEKPMAVSAAEAHAMTAAAHEAGKVLLVGHSQSFEPGIQIMRALVESGRLGPLKAINGWNYTDWMRRPRHEAEYDRARGGGVVYRQAAHHVDMVRYIAGADPLTLTATIGDWDPERPGDGAYTTLMTLPGGIPVSLSYSGYGHFSATELTYGIGENGATARPARTDDKYGAAMMERLTPGSGPACFGILVVSCARGDMRLCPEGVRIYGADGEKVVAIDGLARGRHAVLDEFATGIEGRPVTHDGLWGRRNLETCLAMIRSAATGQPVAFPPQAAPPVRVPDAVAARMNS